MLHHHGLSRQSSKKPTIAGSFSRCGLQTLAAVAGLVVVAVGSPRVANATPLLVTNPSFEDPATSTFFSGVPTGWLPFPAPGGPNAYFVVHESGRYPTGADDGDQAAQITLLTTDPGVSGVLYQPLAETLMPNTLYTLSVAVAMSTTDAANGFGNGGALIELYADSGSTLLAGVTTPIISGDGVWTTFTVNYMSPASSPAIGSPLLIRLRANGNGINFTSLAFDNVQLNATAVPEPGTALMASLAVASLALFRPRRKRSTAAKTASLRRGLNQRIPT